MPKVNGLYTGLKYSVYNFGTEVSDADDKLQEFIDNNAVESVVGVTMMPSALAEVTGTEENPTSINFEVNRINYFTNHDTGVTYTPRNKKLLSYPYRSLSVDTLVDSHDYRFELSKDKTKIKFKITAAISPNPEVIIAPYAYNGVWGLNSVNAVESVTLSGFPQCAFTVDSYRAWLAQSSIPDVAGIAAGGLTAVGGGAAGIAAIGAGATGAAVALPVIAGAAGLVGLVGGVSALINKVTKGARTRGSQGNSTLTAMQQYQPHFRIMSIRLEQAQILDDYFDRYGYYCGKIAVPNRAARPAYTYIKTQNVNIRGKIPTADMTKIKSVYNNGCTFWAHGWEVGLISINNQPS